MHTQYSPLQKMELTKQRYIDTQDIHLLVLHQIEKLEILF